MIGAFLGNMGSCCRLYLCEDTGSIRAKEPLWFCEILIMEVD